MQLKDMTGQKVPQVTFRTRSGHEWVDVTSDDLFKDKTVIVFSLPGAYTPTCSSTHLPRYEELAMEFFERGVDDIYCLSVNDTFVMNAWAEDQDLQYVQVIPDGNGEFTAGMGLLVDKDNLGFGKRSWRYSMLVKNGVIEKMFIEPMKDGDPFEVSDAVTMLRYIDPNAVLPTDAVVITRDGCPFCYKAKAMLEDNGIEYVELSLEAIGLTALRALTGRETVPQVFLDGKHIGGSDDLEAFMAAK
ncbi:MAG: glutathione peroxidase [Gammaproteobacteria bacterium]|nr:glutathione peroxidase [Gammaproteobacteria bacterium]